MSELLDCIYLNNTIHDELKNTTAEEIMHGVMVSNMAYTLAKELGESEEFCKDVGLAGMLHDVGKLKLYRYLYGNAKDTLVIEQLKYVRMHPTFSHNILKREHFPDNIVKAVYYHHENYDGTGYPEKLRGDAIPKEARILRVCDVFTALISKRNYRDAFDEKSARDLMIEEVSNYDMKIFLAFLQYIHSEKYEGAELLRTRVTPILAEALPVFEREAVSASA